MFQISAFYVYYCGCSRQKQVLTPKRSTLENLFFQKMSNVCFYPLMKLICSKFQLSTSIIVAALVTNFFFWLLVKSVVFIDKGGLRAERVLMTSDPRAVNVRNKQVKALFNKLTMMTRKKSNLWEKIERKCQIVYFLQYKVTTFFQWMSEHFLRRNEWSSAPSSLPYKELLSSAASCNSQKKQENPNL